MKTSKILFLAVFALLFRNSYSQCNFNTSVTYSNNCTAYLNEVYINELSNINSGCSSSLADYTGNSAMKPTLYRGTKDTIYLRAPYGGYDLSVGVFIDWNGNNIFDNGEYIDAGHIYGWENFAFPIPFTIPANAKLGDIRMRIRSSYYYSTIVSSSDLCTSFQFGETEDYLVSVTDKNMSVSYTTMQPTDISFAVKDGSQAQVLRIEVLGSGVLNPLNLDSLYFRLPNYVDKANFLNASIYQTTTDTFNTITKLASISSPSSSFGFTNLNYTLSGGMNYFWLSLSLSTQASIGDTLDAISDSIFVSGSKLLPSQNDPYGSILVDYCQTSNGNNCSYFPTQVSFGTIENIDMSCANGYVNNGFQYGFQKGATYYATLAVNEASEVALMFDFNSDGDFDDTKEFQKYSINAGVVKEFTFTFPGVISADRVRMRVFASASIQGPIDACSAGSVLDYTLFIGDTSEMYIYDRNVYFQQNLLVTPGEQNILLLKSLIETRGSNPVDSIQTLYASLGETSVSSSISKVSLWYTNGNPKFDQTKATLIGTINNPTGSALAFPVNKAFYLGKNYFWLTLDVANSATEGEKIDLEIDSITNKNYTYTYSKLAKYVQVTDTLWMQDALLNTCRTILFDNGGPSANYSAVSNTVTFYTKGKRYFEFNFSEFDLAANGDEDFIAFYNGDSPVPADQFALFSKSSPPSGYFYSADSIVTIVFSSSNITTAKGFALEMACRFNCSAYPPSLNYSLTNPTCEGGLQKIQTQIGGDFTLPLTYKYKGTGKIVFDSSLTVYAGIPDTSFYVYSQSISGQSYNVAIKDSNECVVSNYIYPGSSVVSPINVKAITTSSCPYDSTGSITLAPTNITGTATYSWTGKKTSNSQNISNIYPGFYQLHVIDGASCKDTSIIVYPNPSYIETPPPIVGPSDLGFDPGRKVYDLPKLPLDGGNEELIASNFKTNPVIGIPSYSYYVSVVPPNAAKLVLDSNQVMVDWSAEFSGNAKLYVQYEYISNGCRSLLSEPLTIAIAPELVNPEDPWAPNAFSPNGDGKNDYFEFKNLNPENDNRLQVYNREGTTVYKNDQYKNDWDGTLNGDGTTALQDGTYFFILENAALKKPFRGYVEIRRKK